MKSRLRKIPLLARANEVLKARLQERRSGRDLSESRTEAARRGIAPLKGPALEAALRKRVGPRTPKAKGELRIFLAYYVSNWEAILPRALEPFGEVVPFNWRENGFDDTALDWPRQRSAMNEAMLDEFFDGGPFDAVVGYLSGPNTTAGTLRHMADAGAAVFNFCWDDKLSFGPSEIAAAVHLSLTNAPDSVVKYAVRGGLAMFWPEAAHPDVHRPFDLPFEFDVGFVGARYGWRPRFIGRLKSAGIAVACHGGGWPNGPLPGEEMVRFYSRCRINLGFSGVGHSRSLMCLKGRDFEVPMSGGLYLTQHNPELERVFEVGREIVTYTDERDCAARIRELLADPAAAAAIRAAGRARCLAEHTYEARWSRVFGMAGLIHGS